MRESTFGTCASGEVRRLRIGSEPGVVLDVLTLGARVHRLEAADAHGVRRNLVLGHRTVEAHLATDDYAGAVVGRYAGRIAGPFELDGRTVRPHANEGEVVRHGGPEGFDRRLWEVLEHADDTVALQLVSPDGDQGFPGELTVTASYAVRDERVVLELEATTTAPTLVNLTSHVYWNLDGAARIDGHVLQVDADHYLPVDDRLVPTGIAPVTGEHDLRHAREVGTWQLDETWVLTGRAVVSAGGRSVEVVTDRPGLQVYTGDALAGRPRAGIALEPQLFPDSPHHPEFPSAVLRPGQMFRARTEWRLDTGL